MEGDIESEAMVLRVGALPLCVPRSDIVTNEEALVEVVEEAEGTVVMDINGEDEAIPVALGVPMFGVRE